MASNEPCAKASDGGRDGKERAREKRRQRLAEVQKQKLIEEEKRVAAKARKSGAGLPPAGFGAAPATPWPDSAASAQTGATSKGAETARGASAGPGAGSGTSAGLAHASATPTPVPPADAAPGPLSGPGPARQVPPKAAAHDGDAAVTKISDLLHVDPKGLGRPSGREASPSPPRTRKTLQFPRGSRMKSPSSPLSASPQMARLLSPLSATPPTSYLQTAAASNLPASAGTSSSAGGAHHGHGQQEAAQGLPAQADAAAPDTDTRPPLLDGIAVR